MLKYLLKRIVGTIPTLIIVVTFVFLFVRIIPGDPARLVAGEQATQQDVEAVREQLGLNKTCDNSVYYICFRTSAWGSRNTSLRTKRPVLEEISGRFRKIRFVWQQLLCCGVQ